MAGNLKIAVTDLAEDDLQRIIEFLEEQWSIELSIRYVDRYYQKLDLIESMPGLGFLSHNSKTGRINRAPSDC